MGAALAACVPPEPAAPDESDEHVPDPANPTATFVVEEFGSFTVELYLDKVPITVSNFVDLAQSGFYDGLHIHRTIAGFMSQFGCPYSRDLADPRVGTGNPPGGTSFTHLVTGESITRLADGSIPDEFVSEDANDARTLSMANTGEPNTGGSQIFINVEDNDSLNWFSDDTPDRHPVFGYVLSGYEEVCVATSKVATDAEEKPVSPIKVTTVTISLPQK